MKTEANRLWVWPSGPHGMAVAIAPDRDTAIQEVIKATRPVNQIIRQNMNLALRTCEPVIRDLDGENAAWHAWGEG